MSRDKDLANLLPPTPPPRPDRRDAAIEAAMRAYDGTGAPPPVPARHSEPRRSGIASNRPLIGALASLALVVSIGLPVWMNSDFAPPTVSTGSPQRESARTAGGPQVGDRDSEPATVAAQSVAPAPMPKRDSADEASQAAATPASRTQAQVPPSPAVVEDRVPPQSEAAFAFAPAPPAPPPPLQLPAPSAPERPAPAALVAAAPSARATRSDDIVVTGARATTEREGAVRSRAREPFSKIVLSDLNRCTVADPRRDIEACRITIEEAVPKSARPFVVDGVSRAWRGDLDGAAAALDRAVAEAPRSAVAYYNRSLVLSRRGQARRADADRERAIELDHRYRAALD